MSRIADTFARLAAAGRQALIPYVTAGDPGKDVTVPLMHAMVGAGADIIELGFPFSDPMADGPVIQLAHERALKAGTTLKDVLAMVRTFRERDDRTPVVLMGYLNPVEAMGYQAFVDAAKAAGVAGASTLDVADVARKVETIRNTTRLPIGVGFGIKDADTAAAVARVSDGVVVGSALVGRIQQDPSDTAGLQASIAGLLREMRSAMDRT